MDARFQVDREANPAGIPSPSGVVLCPLNQIRPHPSYKRHGLAVSAAQLSALAERPDFGFTDPLLITHDKVLIDGYARLKLANLKGRIELPCLQYEIDELQALEMLLRMHYRLPGFLPFNRIVMALDLEPALRADARSNQRVGGQAKWSSTLTEADKIDVRQGIARIARVSVGNVTKVKQLLGTACTDLLQALRNGEVHIHRAWKWRNEPPQQQKQLLWTMRAERGVKKVIAKCITQHRGKRPPVSLALRDFISCLQSTNARHPDSIEVHVIDTSSDAIFIGKNLFRNLGLEQKGIS